jgi:hypothetical protein
LRRFRDQEGEDSVNDGRDDAHEQHPSPRRQAPPQLFTGGARETCQGRV